MRSPVRALISPLISPPRTSLFPSGLSLFRSPIARLVRAALHVRLTGRSQAPRLATGSPRSVTARGRRSRDGPWRGSAVGGPAAAPRGRRRRCFGPGKGPRKSLLSKELGAAFGLLRFDGHL